MIETFAITIADAAKACGVGRSTVYELIADKRLDARKIGNRTVITSASLRSFVDSLPVADIRISRQPRAPQTA